MQLSPHFCLDEFCRSLTAVRLGVDMTPPPTVVAALDALVLTVLEPLRLVLGCPVRITSGYRPARLNAAIGGAANSQHVLGQAADIEVPGMSMIALCDAVIAARLPFDQLIHEFGWVHVSHKPDGPQRGQVLTAQRVNGHVEYHPGLPA